MPQSWDMGQMFYFPSEGRHAEDFFNWKNPMALVGSEPAILGTRPTKMYVIVSAMFTVVSTAKLKMIL
jgi:hypothetical protein